MAEPIKVLPIIGPCDACDVDWYDCRNRDGRLWFDPCCRDCNHSQVPLTQRFHLGQTVSLHGEIAEIRLLPNGNLAIAFEVADA